MSSPLNLEKTIVPEWARFFVMGEETKPARVDPNQLIPAIAERLVMTRRALGYEHQADFCRAAGIATNTYNQYEQAKGRPSLDMALKLCRTFGLTLDWIYRGDPSALPYALARNLTPQSA